MSAATPPPASARRGTAPSTAHDRSAAPSTAHNRSAPPAAPPVTALRHGARRPVRARRLAAVGLAAAAAVAVWACAGPLAGVRLMARTSGHGPAQQIGPVSVLTVSLLAGFAGWALLAVLERHARQPRRTWTITAASVLVISLAGPLTAGRGAAAITALACMHLATGGMLIPALRRTAGR